MTLTMMNKMDGWMGTLEFQKACERLSSWQELLDAVEIFLSKFEGYSRDQQQ